MSDERVQAEILFNELGKVLEKSLIALGISSALGIIILINALRLKEWKINKFSFLLVNCVIFNAVLFSVFSSNKWNAIIISTSAYIANLSCCMIYALIYSKSIYDRSSKKDNRFIMFCTSIGLIVIGIELILMSFFASDFSIIIYSALAGSLAIFFGLCTWTYFLNLIRKSHPKFLFIKRIFYASLSLIFVILLSVLEGLIFVYTIRNQVIDALKTSLSIAGAFRSAQNTFNSWIICSIILLSVSQLCLVSLTGYNLLDMFILKRHEYMKEEAKSLTNGIM
jgi:hypothetical protein